MNDTDLLHHIAEQLDKMENHVEGDGTPMNPGIVGVIANHEKRIESNFASVVGLQKFVDRVRWTVIGAAAAGGVIGGGLVSLFTNGPVP